MVVAFCSIGGWCYTCTVSGRWDVSRVISRLYGWVYKTWRLFPLADEHSVAVMTAGGSQSRRSQIVYFRSPIFDFCFIKFVFRISGSIKFWDPSWGLQYRGPSSFTARMEHLFAFQFWYCELGVKKRWGGGAGGGGRKHCFVKFCSLALL